MNEFTNIQSQNKFLISFDVESLFTNIPLSETINLAVETNRKDNPAFPISKANLRELFTFATSQTHFLFNGLFFDQCDGVAMGSPLAPILANLFMGYREEQWIATFKVPASSHFCEIQESSKYGSINQDVWAAVTTKNTNNTNSLA